MEIAAFRHGLETDNPPDQPRQQDRTRQYPPPAGRMLFRPIINAAHEPNDRKGQDQRSDHIHGRVDTQHHPRHGHEADPQQDGNPKPSPATCRSQPAPEQGGIGRVSAGKGITEGRPLCLGHRQDGGITQPGPWNPAYVFQGSSQQIARGQRKANPISDACSKQPEQGGCGGQNPKSFPSPRDAKKELLHRRRALLLQPFQEGQIQLIHGISISCRDDSPFRLILCPT